MITNQDLEFLKENYPSKGAPFCSQKLNKSIKSIYNICSRLKLKYEKPLDEHRVHPNLFYNIEDYRIAYFLGLLWADGSFSTNMATIEINQDDGSECYNFMKGLINFSTGERLRKGRTKKVFRMSVCSKLIVDFLIENDYLNKSLASPNKILSKIPKNLKHYFWLGYSDGDGCFYCKNTTFQYSLTGAYEQDWTNFTQLLDDLKCRYKIKKNINKKGEKYSFVRITSRYDLIIIGNFLYQDKIALKRKYEKYLQAKNYQPLGGRLASQKPYSK